jgi:hypothetical protein
MEATLSDGAEDVRFGNAPVRFWWSSGVVLTYKTWTTTSVTGSSNQNGGNLTLYSHNTKWDEIWLRGPDGVEWSHTFGGLPLPYREGQIMELLFAQSASSDSSVLLLVANRSTERWVTYSGQFADLLPKPWLGTLRAVLVAAGLFAMDSYIPPSHGIIGYLWLGFFGVLAHSIFRRCRPRGLKEIADYVKLRNGERNRAAPARIAPALS